jgi:hypothetical protein
LTAGILLLGAFFAITPSSLNVFADVSPDMLNFTTGSDNGVLHPGDELTNNKTVIINTTSIGPLFNVTWNVYHEGTDDDCGDLLNPEISVLNFTTLNQTEFLNAGNHSGTLNFTETFVGMPGTYHCTTVFEAVNATDADFLGNQTVWIDAIGSKGYWKNHPEATQKHLPILLGNQTLNATNQADPSTSYNVTDSDEAIDLLQNHKGKNVLNRLAGQLLTAKLNIWALNHTNTVTENDKVDCIVGNVTEADLTLETFGWNGISDDPKPAFTKNDRKDALDIHKYLDKFNNYGCPLED